MATIRQKTAINKIVEKRGSVSAAMREAGYSAKTAKNPKNLTNSKSFKELLDHYLPEDLVLKKHKELIEIPVKIRTFIKGDLTTEVESLDGASMGKGIEMAYKLRGSFAPEKHVQMITGLENLDDEALDAMLNDTQPILDRFKKYGRGKLQQTEKAADPGKLRKKSR